MNRSKRFSVAISMSRPRRLWDPATRDKAPERLGLWKTSRYRRKRSHYVILGTNVKNLLLLLALIRGPNLKAVPSLCSG